LKGGHPDPDIQHDNLIILFSFRYKGEQGKDDIVKERKEKKGKERKKESKKASKKERNSIRTIYGRIFDVHNSAKEIYFWI
jgi:hypothetical protein